MMKRICDECGGSGERETTDYCAECPSCFGTGELPSVALILHPDWGARDPYGVITMATVAQYRTVALGFGLGWAAMTRRVLDNDIHISSLPPYPTMRDMLINLADIPELLAARIALWETRDPATQYWLSFGDFL